MLTTVHASKFGLFCKATEKTNFKLLARGMTKTIKIKSAPLQYGRKYESVELRKYKDKIHCLVEESGIVINIYRHTIS